MTGRVVSIDALRGADMLLLAGGAQLLVVLSPWVGGETLRGQLTHAEWGQTLTCWDMVMPLFIFIVGVGMPFAFASYRARDLSTGRILRRVARRCVLLFLLGMLVQGNLTSADPMRMSLFCNTLQAIAEGYLIAALCLIFGGLRSQIITCFSCLLLYWAALRFVPYNSSPPGLFLPHDNLAYFIDCELQGHWQDGTPYTWILTALSFGALTLLGVCGGQILRLCASPLRSTLILTGTGCGCLLAGFLLSFDTPVIKHIYTSSMVLLAAGWCFLLLALFHVLFDIHPVLTRATLPLRVFGCNAILAYLLTQTPGLGGLSLWQGICTPIFGGCCALFGSAAPALLAFLTLSALYSLLLFLYNRNIYLRV